jgi:hypothetical protein
MRDESRDVALEAVDVTNECTYVSDKPADVAA